MAQVGPVDLNRGSRSPVELPTGQVRWQTQPGPAAARTGGWSGPVDLDWRGVEIPGSGVLQPPQLPFAHGTIKWVRRQVRNISGGFFGAPTTPISWTLNKPRGDGDLPASPIPVNARHLGRTYRREFCGAGIMFPADAPAITSVYRAQLRATGDRMAGRSTYQPRMTGRKPNNLTVLAPATSFGLQTVAYGPGIGPYASGGPYG